MYFGKFRRGPGDTSVTWARGLHVRHCHYNYSGKEGPNSFAQEEEE